MSVGSVAKGIVNYPLDKVSDKDTSMPKKILFGALIGGLTIFTAFIYGGYACYYFANRKAKVEDPEKHQSTSKVAKQALSSKKTFHNKVASFYQPTLTDSIQKEGTLTENLVKELIKSEKSLSYNLERFNKADQEGRKFIHDALLSFHSLFEEMSKDKDQTKTYENAFFKAHFLRPHIATFELKSDKSALGNLHLWGSLMNGYAPKGHEDILAITASRMDYNRNFHILFNSVEENMDKETDEYLHNIFCSDIYSKDGCIELVKGKFQKERL